MKQDRRSFLKTGLVAGAAVTVGGGVYFSTRYRTRDIARQLIDYLDHHEVAIQLGAKLLESNTELQSFSLSQMTNSLLEDIEMKRNQLPFFSPLQLLESYQKKINKDFIDENVVKVDGWLLSSTEARLCALLSLYNNTII